MISVRFAKKNFLLNEDDKEVYTSTNEKISKTLLDQFNCTEKEFYDLLYALHLEEKPLFHTKTSFEELLIANLKMKDIKLSKGNMAELTKGINISTIKINDTSLQLKYLSDIAEKHKLSFKKVSFPLERKYDFKKVERYVKEPFGSLSKTTCSTIPLLIKHVLKNIELQQL